MKMINENHTFIYVYFPVHINILIGLTSLIHKLRSIVAPSLSPHKIFIHECSAPVQSCRSKYSHTIVAIESPAFIDFWIGSCQGH